MQINLFSNDVNFIIVGLKDGTYEIEKISHSNGIHRFFGYDFDTFKELSLKKVLPKGVSKFHDFWVLKFMQDGKS